MAIWKRLAKRVVLWVQTTLKYCLLTNKFHRKLFCNFVLPCFIILSWIRLLDVSSRKPPPTKKNRHVSDLDNPTQCRCYSARRGCQLRGAKTDIGCPIRVCFQLYSCFGWAVTFSIPGIFFIVLSAITYNMRT